VHWRRAGRGRPAACGKKRSAAPQRSRKAGLRRFRLVRRVVRRFARPLSLRCIDRVQVVRVAGMAHELCPVGAHCTDKAYQIGDGQSLRIRLTVVLLSVELAAEPDSGIGPPRCRDSNIVRPVVQRPARPRARSRPKVPGD
jgi:hypothetical protein